MIRDDIKTALVSAMKGGDKEGTATIREELAAKEEAEIAVIERFLPAQMSEDEAKAAIGAIITELSASSMKDMGKVMGEVKARYASSIEPARASALVRAALAG